MKKTLSVLIAMLMAFVFVACEDEDYTPVDPTFEKIVLEPNICKPGDKVKAHVYFKNEGRYYYYFKWVYTRTLGSKSTSVEIADRTSTGEPEFTINAPTDPGVYSISFKATVSHSAGKGTVYGESNVVKTTLTVEDDQEEPEE